MSFINDVTFLRKSWLHKKIIGIKKFNEAKKYQGYVCMWQFLRILQHLLMRYVLNLCDQTADMVWKAPFCWGYQMDFSFAKHEAALLNFEALLKPHQNHALSILIN